MQLYSRSDSGKRKPSSIIQKQRWKRALKHVKRKSSDLFNTVTLRKHGQRRPSQSAREDLPGGPAGRMQRAISDGGDEASVDDRYKSVENRVHMLELVLQRVVKAPLIVDEKILEDMSHLDEASSSGRAYGGSSSSYEEAFGPRHQDDSLEHYDDGDDEGKHTQLSSRSSSTNSFRRLAK